MRAWRESNAKDYRGHLKRVLKVPTEEPGRCARFVVCVFLLPLAREVTRDSLIKGTIVAVRALEKLSWLQLTITMVGHLLVKSIKHVNTGAGPVSLQ